MKAFSGSLPEVDLAFLEAYGRRHHLASRSAALRAAVRALREAEAEREYVTAFEEFGESGDAELWDGVSGDGLRA
ncbi:antitoxin [Microbacterium sp. MEC084]|nr:antitoxin [Microbacterium sp. Root53]MCD1268357.1 antitoxin [Microbacterium sp. MEC084]